MRPRIESLWQEHLAARSPPAHKGTEVGGIDLVLLDSVTAGCIQTFLSQDGRLDSRRSAALGLCCLDVVTVSAGLRGEPRNYFERLGRLARLVLTAVRDDDRPG